MRIDEERGHLPVRIVAAGSLRPRTGADAAELAARERLVARVRTEVAPLDGIRSERVRELRRAVASGAYRPDPTAVATCLLRELLAQLLV